MAPLPDRQPALRDVGASAPHHLSTGGIEAVEMFEDSDSIPGGLRGVVRAAPGPIYSPSGVRRFKRLLDSVQPDLVHLHQVTPLISPAVVSVAGSAGVPVVQTV